MERQFQMMKVEAGLYLLPSNDQRWLFKLHKRDLALSGGRSETVWECSFRDFDAFSYQVKMWQLMPNRYTEEDIFHGDEWTHICYVDTRRDAIEEAMDWERGRSEEHHEA